MLVYREFTDKYIFVKRVKKNTAIESNTSKWILFIALSVNIPVHV